MMMTGGDAFLTLRLFMHFVPVLSTEET
jgi:hypothetical protein